MPKLRLSDNTELACDWCGVAGGTLTANLPEATDFKEIVDTFCDPAKTRCLTFVASSETTYCGYTLPRYIMRDGWPTGGILVALAQEA